MSMPDASADRGYQYRHPLPVRLWHWLSAGAVGMLLFTGFNILNVHPRLYWGDVGNESTVPAAALLSTQAGGPNPKTLPAPAALKFGDHTWDVTGTLGVALDYGADGMYFVLVSTPDSWHFGAMRAWHFLWAWVLVLAWLAYATYLAASGRFRRVLWPSAEQRSLRALARDAWAHLRLRRALGDAARTYNPLQKGAYLLVLLVLIPLAVATGLTMSNAITARFPELYIVFGGRQSARTLHALCALLLTLFAVVHVLQVFVAGFWNEIRSMITGYFRIRGGESS
jgi:thiosulfate reductase cytochrome b subunit